MSQYPECEKVANVKERSQEIGEFLDWLKYTRSITLCEATTFNQFVPAYTTNELLLAQYFGIDLKKVEKEKQAILKEIREKNK